MANKVDTARVYPLNDVTAFDQEPGPVVYWMRREQRVHDNWSLLFALEKADEILIVYTIDSTEPIVNRRLHDFMLCGLKSVEQEAVKRGFSFTAILTADPPIEILKYASRHKAAGIITDFNPLRSSLAANRRLAESASIPVWEVDGHNVVPARFVSDKQEYAAYTLRPKVGRVLDRFLTPFPNLPRRKRIKPDHVHQGVDWDSLSRGFSVNTPALKAGYAAGMSRLYEFVTGKLQEYHQYRNDPNKAVLTGLSPYLNCGQIAPQRAAFEIARMMQDTPLKGGILDELIVRRELSDNYCLHNPNYDNYKGFPAWAKTTLSHHRTDKREYVYDLEAFETAATHDPLWNAAMREMVNTGKMHGYLRMYWAKKILEWSVSPCEAMRDSVYLNDKYSLDGQNPNGYAGCAWAIGGLHDRGWQERSVFGKIRYMNYNGCRRKFDVDAYIANNP